MSKETDVAPAKMDVPELTIKSLKSIYQVLFVASVALNIVFSIFAYMNRIQLNRLEIDKRSMENALLAAEHLPSFSTFRLIFETNTLSKFLHSGEQPPFLNGNVTYRILENDVYDRLKTDLVVAQKGNRVASRITFLIVANTRNAPGESVTLNSMVGPKYRVGTIEGHSAVLVPLTYENAAKSIKAGADDLTEITFDVRSAENLVHHQSPISPAVNITWTPVLNDFGNVGRALVEQGDADRLNELLPK
jgi:hypothetical protein